MSDLPRAERNPDGLHQKYIIEKANGQPLDPEALYFVLRLDGGGDTPHVAACRLAALMYCRQIEPYIPLLAKELREKIEELEAAGSV